MHQFSIEQFRQNNEFKTIENFVLTLSYCVILCIIIRTNFGPCFIVVVQHKYQEGKVGSRQSRLNRLPIVIYEKQTAHWAVPPAFVDCSSYVTICSSCYEALFGAICGASVLICPQIQCQRQARQLQPMRTLFPLDVYEISSYMRSLGCLCNTPVT